MTSHNNALFDNLQHFNYADVFEDEFNDNINKNNIDLFLIHLNIRSLNANHRTLTALINYLNLKVDILCLSEIWRNCVDLYTNLFDQYEFVRTEKFYRPDQMF